MKLKPLIILGLVLANVASYAQQVVVDVKPVDFKITNDSLKVSMNLHVEVEGLDSRDAVVLTPYLRGAGSGYAPFVQIQINGNKKQALYERSLVLRRGAAVEAGKVIYSVKDIERDILFDSSVAIEPWMSNSALYVKKEILKYDGDVLSLGRDDMVAECSVSSSFTTENNRPTTSTSVGTQPRASRPQGGGAATPPTATGGSHIAQYKGSFIPPEIDLVDERNQKEMKFSLEEAMIMAETSPNILSLRELYSVAGVYGSKDKSKFYDLIKLSVNLYPVHPTANLNAAAMAIEQGDIQAAGKYLQMAPHDTLAYKNCRGVYELMIGNIYEGVRLLKAAKEAGSEEADHNLKVFFESNK
ncbi:MAG: DUF3868 domain-containing protein [Rikenellaceae bacterium]